MEPPERYEMLTGNFDMLRSENQELQKRLTYMHEAQARQDLKTQQAVEELVDNKSLLESMRTENANLKAEKSLWKSIEHRLSQDNESLMNERARLNGLISNLQSIQSEHERNDSETRRRLVSQAEKLENELDATKRRLDGEIEQTKKNLLLKEIDQKESRRRYDELNTSYTATKQELVAAQTSRDHLQSRVNELILDLKVVEEKLAVYRDKPAAPVVEEEDDEGSSAVEELKIEAADLRGQIEIRNRNLDDLKEQISHFRDIAQATEEQLGELHASHDEYKDSMEGEISKREVCCSISYALIKPRGLLVNVCFRKQSATFSSVLRTSLTSSPLSTKNSPKSENPSSRSSSNSRVRRLSLIPNFPRSRRTSTRLKLPLSITRKIFVVKPASPKRHNKTMSVNLSNMPMLLGPFSNFAPNTPTLKTTYTRSRLRPKPPRRPSASIIVPGKPNARITRRN